MKTPLATEVDLGPGHTILNGVPALRERGTAAQNWAQTSCSPGPIQSLSTISFEPHAKTAEEIDVEKYNFCNCGSPVTLTLDQVEVTGTHIRSRSTHTLFSAHVYCGHNRRSQLLLSSCQVQMLCDLDLDLG